MRRWSLFGGKSSNFDDKKHISICNENRKSFKSHNIDIEFLHYCLDENNGLNYDNMMEILDKKKIIESIANISKRQSIQKKFDLVKNSRHRSLSSVTYIDEHQTVSTDCISIDVINNTDINVSKDNTSIAIDQDFDISFLIHDTKHKIFTKWCKYEHSEENIYLWDYIQQYKLSCSKIKKYYILKKILKKFLSDSSSYEVNLSASTKYSANSIISDVTLSKIDSNQYKVDIINLFNNIQSELIQNFKDIWSRFTCSTMYSIIKDIDMNNNKICRYNSHDSYFSSIFNSSNR